MVSMEIERENDGATEPKEYQTLFWVPMLFQTAKNTENLLEDMLNMIQDFHDENMAENTIRRSILKKPGAPKRRQQILGEAMDSEAAAIQRVDVVMKSESTKFALLTVLKRHFLFSQLRDYELDDVIDVMQAQEISEGDTIIKQGDAGELFYILEEGSCEIVINGESLGSIESGSSFGDLALMYNCPRAATIRAVTDCTLWTLDRIFFRQAMVTSSSHQNVTLSQFLSKISLFNGLNTQQLNQLARSLTKQSYEDHQYIIRQGDIGDQFYVIYKGSVIVSKTDDSGKENVLIELGEGEVFGERALIKKEPRKANVVANGPVEVYYLESQDFYSMLGQIVEKFNKMNEFRIIRSAKIFQKLSEAKLREFISKFTIHRMFHGQRIVCGTGEIFITIDGQYQTSNGERFSSESNVEIGTLERTADEVAGAITILSDEGILASFPKELLVEWIHKQEEEDARNKRRASHMKSSSSTSSSSSNMDGSSQGDANVNRQLDAEREIQVMAERRRESAIRRRMTLGKYSSSSFQDLTIIHPLGKGTFGSVFLCELKNIKEDQPTLPGGKRGLKKRMALKCLNKKAIVTNSQTLYVRREVLALTSFQHPFVSEYYGYFLSKSKICFLLEYIPGGELWSYLYQTLPTQLAEAEATGEGGGIGVKAGEYGGIPLQSGIYYAANIILAIEHVHGLGYCYRDLKPENLMIARNGYLKLVDFGFAKQVPYVHPKNGEIQFRTFTLCGTPDYMAPELILSQGHDRSADYWAYGVLLYELLCGHTPFESSNQQRTFEKIVHSQKHLSFPSDFDPHGKSLIRRLLHPNAALRLGALQNGIEDIRNHAFFSMRSLDFEALLNEEIDMPYIPEVIIEDSGAHLKDHPTLQSIEPIDMAFELQPDMDNEYHNDLFIQLDDPDFFEQQSKE